MQLEQKSAELVGKWREIRGHFQESALAALFVSGFGVAISLLSAFVRRSPKSVTDLSSTGQRVLFFSAALLALAIVVVGVATLLRRRNRDVINLKQRLGEIYSTALRKSALNPQLESLTRNDRS